MQYVTIHPPSLAHLDLLSWPNQVFLTETKMCKLNWTGFLRYVPSIHILQPRQKLIIILQVVTFKAFLEVEATESF